jgi:polyisoprenoid-binding protein YceI
MLVIVGTVYDGDCTPLADAGLNVWQTDANGEYGPGHDTGDMECCYLQGQVRTDENGRYQLNTVRPGHYAGQQPPPPAHIHVEVGHAEAGGLMTEIVFVDDPFLEENRLGGYLVVAPEPFAEADGDYSYLRAVADFVLPGSQATASPAHASSVTDPTDLRTFQIQPGESEAAYHIQEKFIGISIGTRAVGVTGQVQGEIEIDLGNPQFLRSLEVEADLTQLTSGEINRDEKLADQWLVTNVYSLASFTATGTENLSQDYQEGQLVTFTLHGDMTIRDITRPLAFQVSARLAGDTLIGTATAALKMTDFGIAPPNFLDFVVVEDEVGIVVNIVAKEVDGSSGN